MVVITGSAGFIGSCLVSKFNAEGITDLILVDDFSKREKDKNLDGKSLNKKLSAVFLLIGLRKITAK